MSHFNTQLPVRGRQADEVLTSVLVGSGPNSSVSPTTDVQGVSKILLYFASGLFNLKQEEMGATNSMVYGTRRFNDEFTRALQ